MLFPQAKGMGLGDVTNVATNTPTQADQDKPTGAPESTSGKSSKVEMNDQEEVFEEEDFNPIPSRHVRDDLLSSVEKVMDRLGQKVNTIETSFLKRVDSMKYLLMESLHKDDHIINIKKQNIETKGMEEAFKDMRVI